MIMPTTPTRPRWWPRFRSPLRSTALTARLGVVIGAAVGVCMITGLLSHYQYQPWSWLPPPASPVWGYRADPGGARRHRHGHHPAAAGQAVVGLSEPVPLAAVPVLPQGGRAAERAVLVSATLVQVATGFANTLNWYPFRWDFVAVHHALGYVVVGSVLLHVGVKLPDIVYGLQTRMADGDVLTEIPWNENPVSHSNAGPVPPPETPALTRRGVLTATGAGVGLVLVASVGQTVSPLERLGLLAIRQPSTGPQGLAVNRTAEQAQVLSSAIAPDWRLFVEGPQAYAVSLAELEELATAQARYPITCVEGWSRQAVWRGLRLLDLVERAGGNAGSSVRLVSLEQNWVFNQSMITGPQLERALLATHLNGERLNLDHGYPLRLIAPSRPGVLNTKWLARIEVR